MNDLKKIDMFSSPVQLKFKRQAFFKSVLGGFFTIFLVLATILLSLSIWNELFKRTNPKISNLVIYNEENIDINLYDQNFPIAFYLDSNGKFFDESYFSIDYYIFDRLKINNEIVNKRISIGTIDCKDAFEKKSIYENSNFLVNNKSSYLDDNNFMNWKCIKNKNFTIKGNYIKNSFTNLYIEVKGCKNSTIQNDQLIANQKESENMQNNKICKPQNEIDESIKENKLNVYYLEHSLDLEDFNNPIKSSVNNYFILLDPNLKKSSDLYFKYNTFVTDSHFILDRPYNNSILFFSNNKERIEFLNYGDVNNNNKNNPDKVYARVYINSSNEEVIFKRSYIKLSGFLAYLGGFTQVIFFVSSKICLYFNQYLYDEEMINSFFINSGTDSFKGKLEQKRQGFQIVDGKVKSLFLKGLMFNEIKKTDDSFSVNASINNEHIEKNSRDNTEVIENSNHKTLKKSKTFYSKYPVHKNSITERSDTTDITKNKHLNVELNDNNSSINSERDDSKIKFHRNLPNIFIKKMKGILTKKIAEDLIISKGNLSKDINKSKIINNDLKLKINLIQELREKQFYIPKLRKRSNSSINMLSNIDIDNLSSENMNDLKKSNKDYNDYENEKNYNDREDSSYRNLRNNFQIDNDKIKDDKKESLKLKENVKLKRSFNIRHSKIHNKYEDSLNTEDKKEIKKEKIVYHIDYMSIIGMSICCCLEKYKKRKILLDKYREMLYDITDYEEVVNEIALFREFRENYSSTNKANINL